LEELLTKKIWGGGRKKEKENKKEKKEGKKEMKIV